MDTKVVQIAETEVLVRGSSEADLNLDSSPRQVEDRVYENHVAYEQPPLRVQLLAKGVDQELEYERGSSVAEPLEHRTLDDAHEVNTDIEDVKEVQERAANTEAVESLEKQGLDQELVEKTDAKAVTIVGTEAPGVFIGGSSGVDLNSVQAGDRECGDHIAYEQLPLPVKSFAQGVDHVREYEPGSSVSEHLEHTTSDFQEVDTKMEDSKGVQEKAADIVAVELPKKQEVGQGLVSEKVDTEVISSVEKEVPDASLGGSPNLDSCPRQAEDRDYGDRAANDQPTFPVQLFDDYHLKHRTMGDIHVVDTQMEDAKEVQEETADTEAIELSIEHEADQELVSETIDTKLALNLEKVLDVSIGGSPDLDSGSRTTGDREIRDHTAYKQPPLPVKSSDKGGDHGWEYKPGFSVSEPLERRTGDNHEVDTKMEDVKEVQEEAADTEAVELPEEQELNQVLGSKQLDAKLAPNVEEVPDVSVGGSPDLDLDPRQAVYRKFGDRAAYEQPPLPVKSSDRGVDQGLEYGPGSPVSSCTGHRAAGDLLEVDTETDDLKKVQVEAANAEAAELCNEQEVDQERISENRDAKVVTVVGKEVPDVSISGSPDMESSPRQAGGREFGDHAAYEQPSSPVELFANGAGHGQEYASGSSVVKLLEHRASGDVHEVDADMEDINKEQEQSANKETVESPMEPDALQELAHKTLNEKIVPIVETEAPDVCIEGSSGAHLDSCPRQVGDHATYERPSLPVNSSDQGVDHGLECEPHSSIAERALGDAHEFNADMQNFKEVQEYVASTEANELPTEQGDQELVCEEMDAQIAPTVESEVFNVSIGGSPATDLDSGPKQVGDRENRDHAAYELDNESGSAIAEHLELGATGDDDTNMGNVQEVQEQVAIAETVELPEEKVDQELLSRTMEIKKDLIRETEVPDVSTGGSPGNVQEVQEHVADAETAELPEQEEVDQELVSRTMEIEKDLIGETEVPDVSTGVSPGVELDSGIRQAGDREYGDLAVCEQAPLPAKSSVESVNQRLELEPGSSVAKNLEHRTEDDAHEADTNIEDVQEMKEEDASTSAAESPGEQEDQELVSRKIDLQIGSIEAEVPDISTGGSPVVELDSGLRKVGDREYEELAVCDQPLLPAKSSVEGVNQRLESESGSSVAKHLEHITANDVDTNIEDAQEKQEEGASIAAVESPEGQEDQELVSGKMDVKIDLIEETEVSDISTGGSPGVELDSVLRQVGDREYRDLAVCDQPLLPAKSAVEGVNQILEFEEGSSVAKHLELRREDDVHEVEEKLVDVQEMQEEDVSTEAVESLGEQDDQELVPHSEKPRSKEEKNTKRASLKAGSLMKDHRVSYQLASEPECEFAVFDLVWGKVKSHPWWPGQIFHPSDSSEKAMKYYRKDCYLVAYFGDRTFAWNEASVLKPFRNHFPLAERQNKSEAFQNAVSCALEEVARRVELGLACSCLSEEAYDEIKYQIVENTGIREESSKREGVDRSTGVNSFQPGKLTEYLRALAVFPTSGVDRLEIVVAKSQLLALNRLNGCDALPEFQYYEGLVEHDADTLFSDQRVLGEKEQSVSGVDAKKFARKRKHNLKDIVYQRRKEKSMTELMGETMYYLDGEFDSHEEDDTIVTSPIVGSKRKASGFVKEDSAAKRSMKTISLAKVSNTAPLNPQQSFKVGDCIRRVASQMTGSSVAVKGCSEESNSKHLGDDADEVVEPPNDVLTESTPRPSKESSLDEMLSQLQLSARDPMKGYSFFSDIIRFFTEFRNLAVTTQRQKMRKGSGRKKKSSVPVVAPPENFEFDDRNDSYWTDMVVQNNAEAKPVRRGRKRKDEQVVSADPEKTLQPNRRKYSRKQYHHGNHESASEMPTGGEKQLDLPTELLLNFGETGCVPSEANLNKIFRRFGPIKESDTGVDMQSSRARVVFKKRSDAEVAYSSAAMFNIFGSTLVNYQLNYTPTSFNSLPLTLTDGKKDAT